MAKIDATIPDDLRLLLDQLAEDSGQSMSSLIAHCLKLGVAVELEHRNKIEVYRKLRDQRLEREKKKD